MVALLCHFFLEILRIVDTDHLKARLFIDAEQQYAAAQESPADAGFTAELAMTTTDQMLMARIASEAPELRPCLARNPYIYPELLAWLGQLNDSAINAAIRLRQQ